MSGRVATTPDSSIRPRSGSRDASDASLSCPYNSPSPKTARHASAAGQARLAVIAAQAATTTDAAHSTMSAFGSDKPAARPATQHPAAHGIQPNRFRSSFHVLIPTQKQSTSGA